MTRKHPIKAKRNKTRGGVRGHLARRNRALATVMGDHAVFAAEHSKDGKVRIPFLPDVPKKVRDEAFQVAAAELGQRGGTARAKSLSAKERKEIARRGGIARWKKAGK
jgi:hypothetical protein